LTGLFIDPEDGNDMFLRSVSCHNHRYENLKSYNKLRMKEKGKGRKHDRKEKINKRDKTKEGRY
jgi:hypothetical protein